MLHSRCLLAIKVPVDQPTNSPFLVPHLLTFPPHPKKEIPNVIETLCTTRNANELEATVKKYFAADAEFFHPLCKANSRNEILGLFQWYRLASPKAQIKVLSVMYDNDLNVLVVEVQEKVNVWFNPLPSKVGRMIVRLQLRKANGGHVIVTEEDLTHPMDQIGFFASPLLPLANLYLRLGCLLSNLGACAFRTVRLDMGLRGGTVDYTGLMEAAGLARKTGDKHNGIMTKE
ncbi:hypothetical protein V8E55_004723 [Tylopilus felleus]